MRDGTGASGAEISPAGFEAAIGLVDDVDPALPAHQAIIAVPAAQGFQGVTDFHDNLGLLFAGYIRSPPRPVNASCPPVVSGHRLLYSSGQGVQAVQRSRDRFLTTHTGSLPRPDDLIRMMYAKEEGVPVDPRALAARVRAAVAEVVKKQADAGIDLINDGEMSKPSYATYIKDRLDGFGGTGNTFVYQDLSDFPRLEKRVFGDPGRSRRKTPACNAPISVRDKTGAANRRG